MKKFAKLAFISILILIIILILHSCKKFTIKTDTGDKLVVKIGVCNLTEPNVRSVRFNMKKRERYCKERYRYWLPNCTNKNTMTLSKLFEIGNIHYYQLAIEVGGGTLYEKDPTSLFLILNDNDNCWDLVPDDVVVYDYYWVAMRKNIYLPLAKHFLLQGNHDWLMHFGDMLILDDDKKIVDIITAILDGTTEINAKYYDSEEIYNKCLELIDSAEPSGDVNSAA